MTSKARKQSCVSKTDFWFYSEFGLRKWPNYFLFFVFHKLRLTGHRRQIKGQFGALPSCQSKSIHSDEGLMLKLSAFGSRYIGQFMSVIKSKQPHWNTFDTRLKLLKRALSTAEAPVSKLNTSERKKREVGALERENGSTGRPLLRRESKG